MSKLTREEVEQIVKETRESGRKVHLNGVDLAGIDLRNVDLSGVNLNDSILGGTDFRGADLSKTTLRRVYASEAYLSSANLSGADLREANLVGANLSEANLSKVDLRRADLLEANLRMINFVEANLSWANLEGTNLSEANFQQASLTKANLSRAYLDKVTFTNVTMGYTTLANVDLSTVKGLATVSHHGPSYIDIHTLQRSEGKIPEAFLKGVGISDTFITYLASLTGEAIRYYSCFISYSSTDEAFAQRLHADLQQKGVRCWFAPEDLKIGDKVRSRIDESIKVHDRLLLILSQNSLNSFWVESEVEKAFEEEHKRNQTVLFPVRLDEVVMKTDQAWAGNIRRTRHIGDFSQWKDHDAYQKAFERLLRDLKAG